MSVIKIAIADPQTICREGVRSLLEHQEGFEVVGEASDGMEAAALAKQARPDVLLLELRMPRSSGLATLKDLKSCAVPTRCLLLAETFCREEVHEAIELGAYGWISKSAQTQLLFRSIRAVASGEYWIGRENIGQLVQAFRRNRRPGNGLHDTGRYGLTPRQLDVIAQILSGASNRDIANEFGVSQRTIKQHLTHIFDKVGASSRLELAMFAVHHHLVE